MSESLPSAEKDAGQILRQRLADSLIADGARVRVWPPADWCAAINPERTHICDKPRGHTDDHSGPEMPTVEIDVLQ